MVYFIAIEMVALKEFLSICSFGLVLNTFVLTYGHIMTDRTESEKNKKKIVLIAAKLLNIGLVLIAFLCIFASDLHFDIAKDLTNWEKTNGKINLKSNN